MTEVDERSLSGLSREQLLRRAALGGALLATGGLASVAEASPFATPKRGGRFRIGVPGGGSTDFIDGQHIVTEPDIARNVATFEGLAYFDDQYRPALGLAEEITNDKPDVWTVRVRQGIEFHNGKTLDADDVAYSFRRTVNPKLSLFGKASMGAVDPNRIRKLDKRTVRLTLRRPDVTLIDAMAQYFQGVVPNGYSPNAVGKGPLRFIGTGAFKVQSFTPGRQSVHVRNENYWRTGQPYFDEVVIVNFGDDTARVNALLGGQVEAIVDLPIAQIPVIKARQNLKVYEAPTGGWLPFTMRVDAAPFTDNRVRQAFKLIANRKQMVQQALAGHGVVGNDVYSPFDRCYSGKRLPQREQDLERARFLLKQAGQEGMKIDLNTTAASAGMVEAAQVFAENAKGAGITVTVKNLQGGTFYGSQYLKWVFAMDFWGTRNYLAQVAAGGLSTSPFNETHWDKYPKYKKFLSLYNQALGTVDRAKRCDVIAEMQRLEYNEGGNLVWGFYNNVSAHSSKVGGFKFDRGTLDLNKYGNNFRTIYFV